MKNSRMQKLMLSLLVVLFSGLAKSQDSTDYTLNNLKRYANRIDESFSALAQPDGNKQKVQLQTAERLKAFSDSISEEMDYLPDAYYFQLSPLASAYRADLEEYEKLVANDDFEGKEKYVYAAIASLQQRQANFRQAVALAYTNLMSGNIPATNPATESEQSAAPVATSLPNENESNITRKKEDAPTSKTDIMVQNEASKNRVLLDTIYTAMQQIESAIQVTEQAATKPDVSKIRMYTTRIADASLQISGLSLLLEAKGKENLYVLAASLQHAAENLRKLVRKSTTTRSSIADGISEMKIKFGNLSTGLSFVK